MKSLTMNCDPISRGRALAGAPLRKPAGSGWIPALGAFLTAMSLCGVAHAAAVTSVPASGVAADGNRAQSDYGKIPLSFEPNQGQTDARVQFVAHGPGFALLLAPGEVTLGLEKESGAPALGHKPAAPAEDTVRMKLVGANEAIAAAGLDPQRGVVSYLIGNDPEKWHAGIRTFAKVRYAQVYPGVDLVFYGNQRQLEYDFLVAPGADASKIAWQIEGASARVDGQGNMVLDAENGPASFKAPVIYQNDGERRVPVEGAFEVAGNTVHFRLGAYDHTRPLVIDPVLSYASYLGGSLTDNIGAQTGFGAAGIQDLTAAAAVDSNGGFYVTGYTYSPDFPTTGTGFQSTAPTRTSTRYPWSFVSKVSADGSALEYSTYLGGSVADYAAAIAVDSEGNAYVTGYTYSPDFPFVGGYLSFCGQDWTYGPSGPIETDGCPGEYSAFVSKLNPQGTALVYSTFLDGGSISNGEAIAVDSAGRAYVTGNQNNLCSVHTPSYACFPTTSNALISGAAAGNAGCWPIFVSVFDSTGSKLLYSTLLGDENGLKSSLCGTIDATGITVDGAGNFYVIANTNGLAVPTTPGVVQPKPQGINSPNGVTLAPRGYLAKFTTVTSANGPVLGCATYLGGSGGLGNYTSGIAVDGEGNAYVGGYTNAYDLPVTAGAYQTSCGAGNGAQCYSAYLMKLNSTASTIDWGTYFGGQKGGTAVGGTGQVQLDGEGNVYLLGQSSIGIPVLNPVETVGDGYAALVTEFSSTGKLLFSSLVGSSPTAYESAQYAAGMAVDTAGNIYVAGNTSNGLITTPGSFASTDSAPGYYHGFVAKISPLTASTTALTVKPSSAVYGEAVKLTATVKGVGSSTKPTGTVSFYNGSTELGEAPLTSSGDATFSTSALAPAVYALTARYGGNETYANSASSAVPLTVGVASQTITFKTIPSESLGMPLTLTATASSNLPVGFASLTSAVCTVSGDTATLVEVGTCEIEATQAGSADFKAATPVTRSFTVKPPASFTITPKSTTDTVSPSGEGEFTLELKSVDGFEGEVSLSCTGAPAGDSCVVSPATVKVHGKETATAKIKLHPNATAGSYAITFNGVSGAIKATAEAKLVVK